MLGRTNRLIPCINYTAINDDVLLRATNTEKVSTKAPAINIQSQKILRAFYIEVDATKFQDKFDVEKYLLLISFFFQ